MRPGVHILASYWIRQAFALMPKSMPAFVKSIENQQDAPDSVFFLSGANRRDKLHLAVAAFEAMLESDVYSDDDVVIWVDCDDRLLPPCVGVIRQVFSDPRILVSFGRMVTASWQVDEKPERLAHQPWRPEALKEPRKWAWSGWHPKVCRLSVVRRFFELDPGHAYLKDREGDWLKSATDMAFYIPLMELAGPERIAQPEARLYHYVVHSFNECRLDKSCAKQSSVTTADRPPFQRAEI